MLKLTAVLLLAALARTSLAGDTDSDGVEDVKDLCPLSTRGSREHVDVNGCEHDQVDFDMDGWCNPGMPLINKKPFTTRADFCVGVDNCKFVKNPGQEQNYPADNSNDGDGSGDACNTGKLHMCTGACASVQHSVLLELRGHSGHGVGCMIRMHAHAVPPHGSHVRVVHCYLR